MKDAVDSAHVTLCIFMIRKTAEKEGARISSVRLYFTSNAFLFYFSIRLFKELTIPLQGLRLFVDAAKTVGQHGGQQYRCQFPFHDFPPVVYIHVISSFSVSGSV